MLNQACVFDPRTLGRHVTTFMALPTKTGVPQCDIASATFLAVTCRQCQVISGPCMRPIQCNTPLISFFVTIFALNCMVRGIVNVACSHVNRTFMRTSSALNNVARVVI